MPPKLFYCLIFFCIPRPFVYVVVWLVSWQLRLQCEMAHNGAKAGFITSPATNSSSARLCRFIFLALILSVVVVSYYCWMTTVNNSMLQDRVHRLGRDFSYMRSQRMAVEKNFNACKSSVSTCNCDAIYLSGAACNVTLLCALFRRFMSALVDCPSVKACGKSLTVVLYLVLYPV